MTTAKADRGHRLLAPASWLLFSALFFLPFSQVTCFGAGQVVAWGQNNAGQTAVPSGLTGAIAVAGGGLHSLALNSNGTVVAWGFNVSGQTNVPANLTNAIAIAAGNSYSMALRANGTIAVWGSQSAPPAGLSNAIAIAAGWDHSLAIKGDSNVVSWGSQTSVPAYVSNVLAIAAGASNSLALKSDGTVVAWGNNAFGKATVPAGLTNVLAIAAGQDHCMALKTDGTVLAWGGNYSGQTNVPASATNIVAIAAGAAHSLALKNDGTLVTWGDNTYNQTSINPGQSGFSAVACGAYHSLALKGSGVPNIVIAPLSQTSFVNNSATFFVVAVGVQPLNYQWQHNGTNVPGATNSVVTLVNLQPGDAGSYTAVVGNSLGLTPSPAATLTVLSSPPLISAQPGSQSIMCGDNALIRVVATGTAPLSYQWQFGGHAIFGATQSALALNSVTTAQTGGYSVVVSNSYGSITSVTATLTVLKTPPAITSATNAFGKQGVPFAYTITAIHSPISFGAAYLPRGLSVDSTSGIISNVPQESGLFASIISAANACASTSSILTVSITSSVPVITSATNAAGIENNPLAYQITATESPTWFGGSNLPIGLSVIPTNGLIQGQPFYAGEFDSVIMASNVWGVGTAPLHFRIANAQVAGFSIDTNTFVTNYSSPYVLDFMFFLRDNDDPTVGGPLITDPTNISVVAMEDGVVISPTEMNTILQRGHAKLIKCFLVLDFTESVASLSNGNSYGDGISDAVHAMVNGAQDFVNQLAPDAQIGVYEFHRDDEVPNRVINLTTDKTQVNQAIAGIWTNYVQAFPAGSRCWDALNAAIGDLGTNNRDEQHLVVFVSDGGDESSTVNAMTVQNSAILGKVRLFSIGFGAELTPANAGVLQTMANVTQGEYFDGTTGLDFAFDRIGKELGAQYILRWATLKRGATGFSPSFILNYQGLSTVATNPVSSTTNIMMTNGMSITNITFMTNFLMAPFVPAQHTGTVTLGSLKLVPNAIDTPKAIDLRASYVPRYVRQIRIHYQPNWPCIATIVSTNPGEILYNWTMTETNGVSGDRYITLSSTNTQDLTTSIPFADFGNLVHFSLRDMTDASNAFSIFEVDNSIYTVPTNGPSFMLDTNTTSFIATYPVLPHGTPVPWLIQHGFAPGQPPSYYTAAELADTDHDGALNWQEYRANTNPQDATSKLVIRRVIQLSDGRHQITFASAVNRTYRVEGSSSLPQNWQVVQDNVVGTGGDITVTDTRYLPGITALFYRVLVY